MVRLMLLVLVLLMMLPPELQVMRWLMMTPLRCESRGGDQDRVSVREVANIVKFCGGPLGTIESETIIFIIIINFWL